MTVADMLLTLDGLDPDTEIGVWHNEYKVAQSIVQVDLEDATAGNGPVYIIIE